MLNKTEEIQYVDKKGENVFFSRLLTFWKEQVVSPLIVANLLSSRRLLSPSRGRKKP